ncbi:Kinesin-like protein KIF13A [Lamellibrachia satsuma]|nr:Kinesin-like protein KIF13A [Lamellibrachia satsuma]
MPSETVPLKIVAKCRALLESETGSGKKVKVSGHNITLEHGGQENSFTFDHCYSAEVKANQIYRECCDSLIQKALLGYNVTLMTFGAVNRSVFNSLEASQGKKDYFVTVSFLEVLDDKMLDLLNPHSDEMRVREHPQLGIYVDGLSELVVHTGEELAHLYEQGNRARKIGMMGDVGAHRSRATAIFLINMEQKDGSSKVGLRSTITLVDVAGVQSTDGSSSGKAVTEVIKAMEQGGHVPYRDSIVTRLLQESLGGNAITLMFATISPADKCGHESLETLQNARRAGRSVKNHIKVNLEETTSIISDLREEIARVRTKVASNNNDKDDVMKLGELIRDLQVAKRQTWEEKERMSAKFEEERKINLANKGILDWVMDTKKQGNKDVRERILLLQKEKDQLTLEYKRKREQINEMKEKLQTKIAEYSKLAESGKGTESDTKQKVTAIHELKEKLKKETEQMKDAKGRLKEVQDKLRTEKETVQDQSQVKGNAELRQLLEKEERKKLELEDHALVVDEWERVKLETEHQKAEIKMKVSQGHTYDPTEAMEMEMELVDLKGEKSVVSLEIQVLQEEKGRLEKSLEDAYKRQKEEMEIQQLQHFQTFRQYREMFEEQKAVLEQRYRNLLNDAIQDAVFLSTRNNELMHENQALKQEIAEMKDKMTALGSRGK